MNIKNSNLCARSIFVALLTTSLVVLTSGGCSKKDRDTAGDKANEAYQEAKVTTTNIWNDIKSYSYDKRDDFTANAKAMTSKLDAELSELRANYSEANASASRKAAMAELKNDEADYRAKLDALGNATADTWDSAKQNVIAAWDKLQAKYQKARAD